MFLSGPFLSGKVKKSAIDKLIQKQAKKEAKLQRKAGKVYKMITKQTPLLPTSVASVTSRPAFTPLPPISATLPAQSDLAPISTPDYTSEMDAAMSTALKNMDLPQEFKAVIDPKIVYTDAKGNPIDKTQTIKYDAMDTGSIDTNFDPTPKYTDVIWK